MQQPQKTSHDGCPQIDTLETEGYVEACSNAYTERNRQDGTNLMDEVTTPDNLYKAYQRVKAKNGAPGVDGITVEQLYDHMKKYYRPLVRKLKDGTYQPQPVRRVYYPKDDGSKRKLGIPVVLDRVVQQAIQQVMAKRIDPQFSESSYGFRPKRNAKQAIKRTAHFYEQGYRVVVDCDLKSYFDTIHHQKLMVYVREFIQDEILLGLIWKFLKSGIMEEGLTSPSESGAPQGGLCKASHNPPYAKKVIMQSNCYKSL